MITLPGCLWCKRPFRARRGGSPKRFCCAAHRIAFWSAARRWAERAVVSGLLSVDNIRNDAGANICRRYALLRQPVLKSNVGRDGQDRPSEAAAAAVGRSQIEAVLRKANGPLIRAGFPLA